jgi:hypothetical protein
MIVDASEINQEWKENTRTSEGRLCESGRFLVFTTAAGGRCERVVWRTDEDRCPSKESGPDQKQVEARQACGVVATNARFHESKICALRTVFRSQRGRLLGGRVCGKDRG